MEFMKFICENHTGHWWLAVRLSPLDSSNASELPIMAYKELNIELGFLLINLRCTGKIMEAGNEVRKKFDQYILRPPNRAAKSNEAVGGLPPETIKVECKEELDLKIQESIKRFKGEPLVIIVDHPDKRTEEPFSDFPDLIQNSVLATGTKCTRYLMNEQSGENEIKLFLKDPHGALLTDIEMFTGMECKNILYICGKKMDVDALLRSVSILICIQYHTE